MPQEKLVWPSGRVVCEEGCEEVVAWECNKAMRFSSTAPLMAWLADSVPPEVNKTESGLFEAPMALATC